MDWIPGSSTTDLHPTEGQNEFKELWSDRCAEFTAFLNDFTKESVELPSSSCDTLFDLLDGWKETSEVKIELLKDECKLEVIGEKAKVFALRQRLDEWIINFIEQAEKAVIVEEVLREVPESRVELLKRFGYIEEFGSTHKGIEITLESGNIKLASPSALLLNVKDEIIKLTREIKEVVVDLPDAIIDVFQNTEGRKLLNRSFDENGIQAIAVVSEKAEGVEVVLVGLGPNLIRDGKRVIKDLTTITKLPIPSDVDYLFIDGKWTNFCQDLRHKLIISVSVNSAKKIVSVSGIKEQVDQGTNEIKEFLNAHAIEHQFFPRPKGPRRYIFTHYRNELSEIQNKLEEPSLVFQEDERDGVEGILISGTSRSVEKAYQELHNLALRIVTDKVSVQNPSVKHFLCKNAGKGKDLLRDVETEHRCVIEMILRPNDSGAAAADPQTRVEPEENVCHFFMKDQGKKLSVIKGNLTKHRVDVVVNPANDQLKHSGGLARALVEAGGREIQEESKDWVQSNGRLYPGDTAETTSGTLPCHKIIHVVGPKWKKEAKRATPGSGKKTEEEKILNLATRSCLEAGGSFSSIALPAISTGMYEFPYDLCAEVMVNAALEFCKKSSTSSRLTDIRFVCNEPRTVVVFTEEFRKRFGNEDLFFDGSKRKVTIADETPLEKPETKPDVAESIRDGNTFYTSEGLRVSLVSGDIKEQKVND